MRIIIKKRANKKKNREKDPVAFDALFLAPPLNATGVLKNTLIKFSTTMDGIDDILFSLL